MERPGPCALRYAAPTAKRRSGGSKRSSTASAGPRRVHVDVVGERHQRHELCAGRPGADLGHGERAVGAAEPLHVRQPGPQPERGHGVVAEADDVGVLRSVDVPRQHDAPLDPRVRQHVERARQVAADRVPDEPAVDHDAVEGVLVAADELLEEHRFVGTRRGVGEPCGQLRRRRRRGTCCARRRRPAAWRRTGSRPGRRSALASSARGDPPAACARHAGRLEGRLHARLVAEAVGDVGRHAGDAQALAHLRQRDLEVLQDGDEAVDRAEVAAHRRHGLGEPVGVEAVVDAPVRGGGQAHRRPGTPRSGRC